MLSPRTGLARRSGGRTWSVRVALAVLGLVGSTGCQVEYAGMTLPSGKYMHDDVQYFAPGPEFPFANTQAATQRARMSQMGIQVPPTPDAANAPGGMQAGPGAGGTGIPRLNASPEAENSMPGGASAPNPAVPGPAQVPNGGNPGAGIPAPM